MSLTYQGSFWRNCYVTKTDTDDFDTMFTTYLIEEDFV